jgi:phenylacetate-CoA ligase
MVNVIEGINMYSSLSRTALKFHEWFTRRKILTRLEDLKRTQWMSRDEMLAMQYAKLMRLLEYAYQNVPYYRRTFSSIGFLPGDLYQDLSNFTKLPVLTKEIIRENYVELQTTDPARQKEMHRLSTSGSTGQPLIFMQDSDFRDSVTADIQRHMGWAGWELGDLQAFIWGAGFKPSLMKRMRTQLIDWVWNRFQINAMDMTPEALLTFTRRVRQEKPFILFGYATSLYRFAQFVRSSAYRDITFDGIFSSAEVLLPPVRKYIEETFWCHVYNRYGTLELGGIACECEAHTGLHVSVENNYVEIVDDGKPAAPGVVGDIVVTNLNNLGMPFIRYVIKDAGAWHPDENCPCGRVSPMLQTVEGRIVDSFKTRDGRIVWCGFAGAAFRCLAHPTIKQFQIVQKTYEKINVRLSPNGVIPQPALDDITMAIQSTFGENIEVGFEFMEVIPPLPSGKHQYAVSEVKD